MKYLSILSAISIVAGLSSFEANAKSITIKELNVQVDCSGTDAATQACVAQIEQASEGVKELIIKNCTTGNGCRVKELNIQLPDCVEKQCTLKVQAR